MALILGCRGNNPQMDESVWMAPNCTIVGDVVLGKDCSVWFNAVIRGDVNSIRIGNSVNIQDGAVLHCTYEKTKLTIADNVSIGHNACVHGCTIKENVLIGMNSTVMDNVVIDSGSIVAAGSVVLENTHIQSGEIWAGVPAKKVKQLSAEMFEGEVKRIAMNYKMYSSWFE